MWKHIPRDFRRDFGEFLTRGSSPQKSVEIPWNGEASLIIINAPVKCFAFSLSLHTLKPCAIPLLISKKSAPSEIKWRSGDVTSMPLSLPPDYWFTDTGILHWRSRDQFNCGIDYCQDETPSRWFPGISFCCAFPLSQYPQWFHYLVSSFPSLTLFHSSCSISPYHDQIAAASFQT